MKFNSDNIAARNPQLAAGPIASLPANSLSLLGTGTAAERPVKPQVLCCFIMPVQATCPLLALNAPNLNPTKP